jgi:hypothetical protein
MEIDKAQMGNVFATEVDGVEISEALNRIQKVYDEYLKPAWDKADKNDPSTGAEVAKRGFAFLVATGAFHMLLCGQSRPEMGDTIADAVANVVMQMQSQIETKKKGN